MILTNKNYVSGLDFPWHRSLRRTLVLLIILSIAFLNVQVSDTTGDAKR
jgi:hypothetical protein